MANDRSNEQPASRAGQRRQSRRALAGAIVLVLLWLAIGAVGGQKMGGLSALQKNDTASFLPDSAESTQVVAELKAFTDHQTLPLIVVAERAGGLTPADLALTADVAKDLPGQTLSLPGEPTLAEYLNSPAVVAIPSQDGRAVMMIVPLASDRAFTQVSGEQPLAAISTQVKAVIDDQLRPAGLTAYATGPAGFIADLSGAFAGIDGILLLVALTMVLIILLVVYRSPILPLAVLLTAVLGLSAAGAVVYWVADNDWVTVSGQSQGILSILVVGAATDYALLLVSRYKEELHHHESPWEALKIAWRASVEPILASGGTVILGLLALLLADLKGTEGLGPVGALGIVGALVAALTFLPAVLVLGRRWIFWPAIPKLDHVRRTDALKSHRGWGRLAAAVGNHPRRTWVITALALVIAASFLPTLKTAGISDSDVFLTKVDAVDGQELLVKHFDAGSGSPLQVIAPEASAQDVIATLKTEDGLVDPYVGLNPGQPSTPVDGKVVIQATFSDPADSEAALTTVERVRADLHALGDGILVGGETAQQLDTRTAADRDLLVVVPTIIVTVFLVLCLLLRCLVAPLLLMVANVLSFAATMGISAVMFNHVFGFAGGDPTTVLYGFVFLVALGVDYSIFLMTRAREETARHGHRTGVLTALAVTGGVITSAGLVLAATFGALVVIPLLFLAQVAFIVAFGVLLDTLVVRSLLVPALSLEIGKRTWWPSALARASSSDGSAEAPTQQSVAQ